MKDYLKGSASDNKNPRQQLSLVLIYIGRLALAVRTDRYGGLRGPHPLCHMGTYLY